MGKRTEYAPGVFNWVELSTTDPGAAKAFYGTLFGWTADDESVPEEHGGGSYTTLRLHGDAIASMQEQPAAQRNAGVPAHWLSCVSVADADATARRVEELGGTVLTTYDVMAKARLAIVADPTGAFLGAWQAGESSGAERVNDPGCSRTTSSRPMTWIGRRRSTRTSSGGTSRRSTRTVAPATGGSTMRGRQAA